MSRAFAVSDDPSVTNPPFQFTIRTLIAITAVWAFVLRLIRLLGMGTAPAVLTGVGILTGYLLGRPRGGLPCASPIMRTAWMVLYGFMGNVVGLVMSTGLGAGGNLDPAMLLVLVGICVLAVLYAKGG